MRLFVAADVMPDAQLALARTAVSVRAALGPDASAYRFVRAEQMHLTVVFLGAVPLEWTAAYAAAMAPSFRHPAFTMLFTRVGVFPSKGAPKVVWAGLDADRDAPIRALRAEVLERLARAQAASPPSPPRPELPDEGSAFHPHVTLARARRGGGRASVRPAVESIALGLPVRIASVTLFESLMRSDGPPCYRVLARAELS